MPKKPSKKTLVNKLDRAWSKVILSKGKCEVCGSASSLNPHHYISRSNRSLRWEPCNGVCVCVGHHLFKNESFHKDPEWGHYWFEENRWEDLCKINVLRNQIKKWSTEEMQEQLNKLLSILDD